jgi:hypothetical protein
MKKQKKLFQNFSFWNSLLRFKGKTGLLAGFSESLFKTNRVLEQAQKSNVYMKNAGVAGWKKKAD